MKDRNPRPCVICSDIFHPLTCQQVTCGKPDCKKAYQLLKSKEHYYKTRRLKKKSKYISDFVEPDKPRTFTLNLYMKESKWYWKAIADNGSCLENGPFETMALARKDYNKAILGE